MTMLAIIGAIVAVVLFLPCIVAGALRRENLWPHNIAVRRKFCDARKVLLIQIRAKSVMPRMRKL